MCQHFSVKAGSASPLAPPQFPPLTFGSFGMSEGQGGALHGSKLSTRARARLAQACQSGAPMSSTEETSGATP